MQRRGGTYDIIVNRLKNTTGKVTTPTHMNCVYVLRVRYEVHCMHAYANHVRARTKSKNILHEMQKQKENGKTFKIFTM